MKKIEAVFRHSQLEKVKQALNDVGVKGMTIVEVRGAGKQKGYTETYRGSKVTINLRPKVELKTIIPDEMVEQAVEAIVENARTGQIGDGKIFISNIEETVRIRTGEKGTETLT
ncbi:MAG: P-II family nitrogen regulator [Actinobacteria bacterium]|nr:MAG: P-II family nitrogen regulator [Actinomycetota bacterium]